MHIDKRRVVALLRSKGEHDKAQQADCALPQYVDPDEDAGLLHAVGVHVADVRSR